MIGASKKVEAEILDEHEVFVGKDVLELLSSSMYVNPPRSSANTAERHGRHR